MNKEVKFRKTQRRYICKGAEMQNGCANDANLTHHVGGRGEMGGCRVT